MSITTCPVQWCMLQTYKYRKKVQHKLEIIIKLKNLSLLTSQGHMLRTPPPLFHGCLQYIPMSACKNTPCNHGMLHKCVNTACYHLSCQEWNQETTTNIKSTVYIVSFTYPKVRFDVDISSFLNEVTHCVNVATLSCPMEGSPLMREMERELKGVTWSKHSLQQGFWTTLHSTADIHMICHSLHFV